MDNLSCKLRAVQSKGGKMFDVVEVIGKGDYLRMSPHEVAISDTV